MVGGEISLRGDRGGEVIPALRATSVRLGLGTATLAIGTGLAAYLFVEAGRAARPVDLVAALAVLFLASSVLGLEVLPLALATFATGFLIVAEVGGVGPLAVIGYAAGLLVLCELGYAVQALPRRALVDSSVVLRRLLLLVGTGAGGALVALVSLLGGSLRTDSALEPTLIGIVGSVALMTMILALVRRQS
jgi:hypothetical protein